MRSQVYGDDANRIVESTKSHDRNSTHSQGHGEGMNRIVEHSIERRNDARTGVANFMVPNMSLIEYDCAVKSSTYKLSDILGLNPSDKYKMNLLVAEPCAFDYLLQTRGQMNFVVTMQEDGAVDARQVVATSNVSIRHSSNIRCILGRTKELGCNYHQ